RATELISASSSGGPSNNGSHDSAISTDGRYVAFDSSASNLVPNDTNSAQDVFIREGPDTDDDGYWEGADNCPTTANADQADANGDLHGDACETAGAGNVDCSNAVNSADALKVLRFAAGLSVAQTEPCADL